MKARERHSTVSSGLQRNKFPPLEERRAPVPALVEGDRVQWVEWDRDIPKGHIGEVLGYMPNGRAKCRFPKGLFALQPHSLVRATPTLVGAVINGRGSTPSAAVVADPAVISAAIKTAVTESRRDNLVGSTHVLPTSRNGFDLVSDPLVSTTSTPTHSGRMRRSRTTRSCEPVLGARSTVGVAERGSAGAAHMLSMPSVPLFVRRPLSGLCSTDSSGSSNEWDSPEHSGSRSSSSSSIGSNGKSNSHDFLKSGARGRKSRAGSGRPQDLRIRSLDSIHFSVQSLHISDNNCSSRGNGNNVELSSKAIDKGEGTTTAVSNTACKRGAPLPPFEIGDVVSWKGADSDLPRGTLGTVSKLHDDGDVEATFGVRRRQQTFTFSAHRLNLEKTRLSSSSSTASYTASPVGKSVVPSRSSSLSPNVSIHRKHISPGARTRKRSSSADYVACDLLALSSNAASVSPPAASRLCPSNVNSAASSSLPLHSPPSPEQLKPAEAETCVNVPLLAPKVVAPPTRPRTEKREQNVSMAVNFAQPFGMHLGRQSLMVYAVQAGSQAEARGIATGWRCTAVGGQPVTDLDSFKAEVSKAKTRMASLAAVQVAAAACAHGAAAEDYDDEGQLLPIPLPPDTSTGLVECEETLEFAVPLVMDQNRRFIDEEEEENHALSVQSNNTGTSLVEPENPTNVSASFKPTYSPTTVMSSASTPTAFADHANESWQSSSSNSLPQVVGSPLHNTYRELGDGEARVELESQHRHTMHENSIDGISGASSLNQNVDKSLRNDSGKDGDSIEITSDDTETAFNHADCVICLEPLTQEASCLLPCRHSFHVACVAGLRAAGVSQACPMCRAALPPGPDQLCDEATWRYFVLKRHVARGEATFADPSPAERRELAAVIRLWESAAKEGSALAMHNLGCLYEKGRGVPQSDCEAAHWHERAATVGLAAAQFALGFLCEHGRADGGTADGRDGCSGAAFSSRENAAKHAAKWYLAAALQGDAKAQCNLGVLYEQGRGVLQSDSDATRWYQAAASQGLADAQFNLGNLYHKGRTKDSLDADRSSMDNTSRVSARDCSNEAEAVRWFQLAAEQGHMAAEFNLGVMFEHGRGVAQSYIRAAHWYREAADGGHAAAQNNLGLLCEYGKGVEASDADALQWYYAAALQGNARAQSNLAYFYAHGRGLPQSTIDAQVWYERAAAQGDETAIKALKRLIQDS